MKIITLALAFVASSGYSESADELARRIIKSQPYAVYNMFDGSNEDLKNDAILNNRFRLVTYMCSDEAPEEIRISYALEVYDLERFGTSSNQGSEKDHLLINEEKKILVNRLIEIQKERMPNKSAHTTPAIAPR